MGEPELPGGPAIPLGKISNVWCHPKRPNNAHLLDGETDRVRIIHPFHPLHGQELKIVDQRHCQDGPYVYVDIGNGKTTRLPFAWTSLGALDPFIQISAGRSLFLIEDLLRLSRLVADIIQEGKTSNCSGGDDAV